MRAFVLCTGRCGSTTVARACEHITNYTVGHESRAHLLEGRLDYPDDHIEVDNRLAWHLGELEERFGDDPLYVFLTRYPPQVARSYARRWHVRSGILRAYAEGIVRSDRFTPTDGDTHLAAWRMVETMNANIRMFLRRRSDLQVIQMPIEDPHKPFDLLWAKLEAEGDRASAHETLDEVTNASRKR